MIGQKIHIPLRSILLVAVALGFAGQVTAQQCDRLDVSAPPEYPPFSYTNQDGLDGAGVEIAKGIAARLGVPLKVRSGAAWARVYREHLNGEIDLVAALYRTPAREKDLIFIGTYAAEKTILVAPKAKPLAYKEWPDLIPFMGAIINGDSRGVELDTFIRDRLQVVKVHSFVNVESLLKARRVDYALVGEYSPKVTAFDYRSPNSPLYADETPLTEQQVYISLSKASPCAGLAPALQEAFQEIATPGFKDNLLMRHATKASGRAIRRN